MAAPNIQATSFDRSEVRPCTLCKRGVMHSGPIFYELKMAQCIADAQSIQRQHGLEVMFGGNAGIAAVFAPSTQVAYRLPPVRHLICAECAVEREAFPVIFLAEPDHVSGRAAL